MLFAVALRRANLSVRNSGAPQVQPPKKERSLPWWDDARNYYIHGNITLFFSETRWHVLATSDPYEKLDQLHFVSGLMEIQQSDGRVYVSAQDFKILISSLEKLASSCGLKLPSGALLEASVFTLEVTMEGEYDSGTPLNHYLFALPIEGKSHEIFFDLFRSTSLSLRWNFSLRPSPPSCESQSPSSSAEDSKVVDGTVYDPPYKPEHVSIVTPTLNVGAHDLTCRGKQKYIFECNRDPLDLVYQGLDSYMPKAILDSLDSNKVPEAVKMSRKNSQSSAVDRIPSEKHKNMGGCTEKRRDDGFLLSCDYFTIRRQSRKADANRLSAWPEAGRRNLKMTYVRSEFENGSGNDDRTRSDPSDDDGYNVVIADNCQRVFVYGLKLLWTTENRDAVWSWTSGTLSSPSDSAGVKNSSFPSIVTNGNAGDSEEEGVRHFMVKVIEPQFNLQSEEANKPMGEGFLCLGRENETTT
ncbi:hypothetical protein NC652_013994 [Populus alba x Populus x berolinensis]|uniref:Uncharacterized protein n=1 Tax=Populus alba x Populus x berolinensis TaxID=444605 RepID=A0AAD6QVQ3_9ROSI|nr:hypothetical protein NC652_013994 [Populus alba x Populus x berolinensis]KAJ6997555.1 hypothetical protein NC653_013962 [Populus alba x Populus x berolinensis]